MKILRNIIIFTTIFILCVNMVSCSMVERMTYNSKEKLEEYGENVYNALVAHDTEALKALFCEELQNNYDLDSDIEAAYEFLGDNIQGYDEMECRTHGESIENGKTTRLTAYSKIRGVKTDKDIFEIHINVMLIYEKNSKYVGIQSVHISNPQWNAMDSNTDTNKLIIGQTLKGWS